MSAKHISLPSDYAIKIIIAWWKKHTKDYNQYKNDIELVVNQLEILKSIGIEKVEECEKVVFNPKFLNAIQKVVGKIPSIRMFATGIIIGSTGQKGLLHNTFESESNLKPEAKYCQISAGMLLKAFQNLISQFQKNSQGQLIQHKLKVFHYAYREFARSFTLWKKRDKEELIKTFEETYAQCYSIYLNTKQAIDNDDVEPLMLSTAQSQLNKIIHSWKQLTDQNEQIIQSKVEEIQASIEASMVMSSKDQEPDSPFSPISPKKRSESSKLTQEDVPIANQTELKSMSSSFMPQFMTHLHSKSMDQLIDEEAFTKINNLLHKIWFNIQNSSIEIIESEERLAYEIALDPYFRLNSSNLANKRQGSITNPDVDEVTSESQLNGKFQQLKQKLQQKLLQVLSDRLVCSLKRSTVIDPLSIEVGDVVMVKVIPSQSNEISTKSLDCSYMSAKIVAKHLTDDAKDVVLDVEYVADGMVESSIPSNQIKLSSEPQDPIPLIAAIQDILSKVALLTPNRPDLHEKLMKSFDPELLQQMIHHEALDPIQDLLPILNYIIHSIIELQSPSHIGNTQEWMKQYTENFVKVCNSMDNMRKCDQLSDVAAMIPRFFEQVMIFIEEIRLDASNYYITILRPQLHPWKGLYLATAFLTRLHNGLIGLNNLASLLASLTSSSKNIQTFEDELIECGVYQNAKGSLTLEVIHDQLTREHYEPTQSSSTTANTFNMCHAILAYSIIVLLQTSSIRLDSEPARQYILPETMEWDGNRFAAIRDLIDMISIELCILLAVRQFTLKVFRIVLKESDEVELQFRMNVLLRDKAVNRESIVTECNQFIKFILHRTRSANSLENNIHLDLLSPDELYHKMEQLVADSLSDGNPVFTLFNKRLYRILFRVMLHQPYQHKLPSFSLQSAGQTKNLRLLIDQTTLLFHNTTVIHEHLYRSILLTLTDQTM